MNSLRGTTSPKILGLPVGFAISLFALAGGFQLAPVLSAEFERVAAKASVIEPQAIESARIQQKLKQTRQIQPENYDLQKHPVSDAQEKHWKNILWTTAIVEPQDSFVVSALNGILSLSKRSNLSTAQTRTVEMAFQIGTQLYLSYPTVYGSVGQQFIGTIEHSSDSRWVAMALSGLAQGQLQPSQIGKLSDRIRQRFPQWSQDIALRTTLQDVSEKLSPSQSPPLKDLLNWTIAPGQMHLYVLCSRDRNSLCTMVLKDPQGKFVRTANLAPPVNGTIAQPDKLWSVPLLLRSIHGLGWNFTRGETPQGIYRVEGITPQPDTEFFRAYGQFSLVNLYLPFESGPQAFLPGKPGPFLGNLQDYRNLLPPTWQNYVLMQQSYWAGKMGRGLFRIHGSGEATDFFRKTQQDTATSQWNPTLGCLSAVELYDTTGKLQRADMPGILNMMASTSATTMKIMKGYLIVVEIPSPAKKNISVEDIDAILR